MKTSFTPGPWTNELETDIYAPGPDGKLLVAQCDVSNFIPYKQRVSNARLIASSPDLLEALQGTLSWLTSYPGGGALKAYDKARAAIAKATGKEL